MEFEVKTLVSHLLSAEEGSAQENWGVSDYVLTHILFPLLSDEEVLFSELDFSRFDYDDITMLGRELEDCSQTINVLGQIRDIFLRARPVSTASRAFF